MDGSNAMARYGWALPGAVPPRERESTGQNGGCPLFASRRGKRARGLAPVATIGFAFAAVLALACMPQRALADDQALQAQVRALTEQVGTLQTQLTRLQALVEQLQAARDAAPLADSAALSPEGAASASQVSTTSPAGGTPPTAGAPSSAPSGSAPPPAAAAVAEEGAPEGPATTIGGYGELNYNNYVKDSSRNQADLRRFVLGLGHRFNDQLAFNGEVEWEHAVASASDRGETEIEQAYLDYNIKPGMSLKTGLILMPFGFLNQSHEPPVYYGVERNFVETLVIPSTWREGGMGLYGTTESGFAWDVGLTTGFDIAKFDDPSAPLASMAQELQFAHARDLSGYATLNYRGMPGLTVGGAVFHGNTGQGNADHHADNTLPDFAGIGAPLTLWDLHARWQASGLDLEALVAQGHIGDADKVDNVLLAYNAANGTRRPYVPADFYGWLLQGAYTVWHRAGFALTPFLRYEQYNTQSIMPAGFASDPANADRVATVGLSFYPHPQVVFKADYQRFLDNSLNNRFNLGMGYMF